MTTSSESDADRDVLFEELRAARPDVAPRFTDAGSPTALALRDHIVRTEQAPSAQPADAPGLARLRPGRSSGRLGLRAGPRRGRLVAAAAAAAVVVAFVATVSGGRIGLEGPEPAAASIDEVVAASTDAARGSGRATVTFEEDRANGMSATGEVVFSDGDAGLVVQREGGHTGLPNQPAPESEYREVDGELYLRDDAGGWVHHDTRGAGGQPNELFPFDALVLLQMLQPEADFTVVGEEEMDGQHVRHLRAAHPEAISDVDLSLVNLGTSEVPPGAIEGLDVWVDDDDVLVRLDLTLARRGHVPMVFSVEPGQPCPEGSEPADERLAGMEGTPCQALEEPDHVQSTYSVRFHHLGEPATITAPPDAVEMSDIPG